LPETGLDAWLVALGGAVLLLIMFGARKLRKI